MSAQTRDDWRDEAALLAAQLRLGSARPPAWAPGPPPLRAGGCFVAYARGGRGPGREGDLGWAGATLVLEGDGVLAGVVVTGRAGAAYRTGMLALREGSLLCEAVDALASRPDVLLVDATGRDHPRRAGLALHLGAVLGIPTVGVTHRPLAATGEPPADTAAGATAPLLLQGEEVGRWVRTRAGARAVVAHAGWRTDASAAVDVVLRSTQRARTPEPLREARRLARTARAGRSAGVGPGLTPGAAPA